MTPHLSHHRHRATTAAAAAAARAREMDEEEEAKIIKRLQSGNYRFRRGGAGAGRSILDDDSVFEYYDSSGRLRPVR